MKYKAQLTAAIDAVKLACKICQNVQSKLVDANTLAKKDKSPVTVADFGAQALVLSELAKNFPDIPCVGEEDASALRENDDLRAKVVEQVQALKSELSEENILNAIDSGNHKGGAAGTFWTLDPIDGTKGFLRNEQYAVALALIVDGVPVLGVLGCPNLPLEWGNPEEGTGCIFASMDGEGAWMEDLQGGHRHGISVSSQQNITKASFCESVESGHSSHDDAAIIAEKLGVTAEPVRMDSQCKYAAVARGDAAIYLRLPTRPGYEERIWDHAAGWRLLVEAGGAIVDVDGKPLDFSQGRTLKNNRGVVATTQRFLKDVSKAVTDTLS